MAKVISMTSKQSVSIQFQTRLPLGFTRSPHLPQSAGRSLSLLRWGLWGRTRYPYVPDSLLLLCFADPIVNGSSDTWNKRLVGQTSAGIYWRWEHSRHGAPGKEEQLTQGRLGESEMLKGKSTRCSGRLTVMLHQTNAPDRVKNQSYVKPSLWPSPSLEGTHLPGWHLTTAVSALVLPEPPTAKPPDLFKRTSRPVGTSALSWRGQKRELSGGEHCPFGLTAGLCCNRPLIQVGRGGRTAGLPSLSRCDDILSKMYAGVTTLAILLSVENIQ